MSHPRRLAPLRLGAAGLLALALTGCGAGLEAQTYQTRTVADATNANLGTLSVRNLAVRPPAGGRVHEAGSDARGSFTVANTGTEPDVLLEITSPAASEVVLLSGGAPKELDVPARGTTGSEGSFILRGLTSDVGTGEVVTVTMRFERAGTLEAIVPVQTSGRTDRPARTGEPGSEEGEPALQGPAGGHHEDEAEQEGSDTPAEAEEPASG
ncbi:MAG: hypothetical protein JWN08_1008 [Frankiales bacterium]|nr:hypothetical protein [Frankiales bacterium]